MTRIQHTGHSSLIVNSVGFDRPWPPVRQAIDWHRPQCIVRYSHLSMHCSALFSWVKCSLRQCIRAWRCSTTETDSTQYFRPWIQRAVSQQYSHCQNNNKTSNSSHFMQRRKCEKKACLCPILPYLHYTKTTKIADVAYWKDIWSQKLSTNTWTYYELIVSLGHLPRIGVASRTAMSATTTMTGHQVQKTNLPV